MSKKLSKIVESYDRLLKIEGDLDLLRMWQEGNRQIRVGVGDIFTRFWIDEEDSKMIIEIQIKKHEKEKTELEEFLAPYMDEGNE